ncbi:radical SAM family heme chaperone HemW [Spiroplasma endosymbiont of Aspidapion aeneum]|uniref:radical SAM family heme chaperone HemW n=1 Tax=Spiroplasma endosymbiont of Aspidapion aeneum TaxID=3066276 RepID=UPI00313DCF89
MLDISLGENLKHLYIHIPFCSKICYYCDFVKQILPKNKKDVMKYLFLLIDELDAYKDRLNEIETIYIGGGTPSCLESNELEILLNYLFKFKNVREFTIELNPESMNIEKLKLLKRYNVNRLSIGCQSFNNNLLKSIGREHNIDQSIKSINIARSLGFQNISIDLIYNIYGQTDLDIKTDLEYINKIRPNHISWYSLILKENSIWGKIKKSLPENDIFFDSIVNNGLKKLKYRRYEISNYTLDNKESLHNIGYWMCNMFAGVGFGASGYEYIGNKYFLTRNINNIMSYNKKFEELSIKEHYFNKVMMGLRLISGIEMTGTNEKIWYYFYDAIQKNLNNGLLVFKDNFLKCSERGYEILNSILIDFI